VRRWFANSRARRRRRRRRRSEEEDEKTHGEHREGVQA